MAYNVWAQRMDVDQQEGAAIADAAAATGAAADVAGAFAFDAAGAIQRGQRPGGMLRGDGGLIHRPTDAFGRRGGRGIRRGRGFQRGRGWRAISNRRRPLPQRRPLQRRQRRRPLDKQSKGQFIL